MSLAIELLALVGLLTIALILADLLWELCLAARAHIWPRLVNSNVDLPAKYGPWAVVTGCTDGIGKAYAFELAKRHMNIVLISRNEEKLQRMALEIESKWSVRTKIITADFSRGQAITYHIESELKGIPVGILVNGGTGNVFNLSNYYKNTTCRYEVERYEQIWRPLFSKKKQKNYVSTLYSRTKAFKGFTHLIGSGVNNVGKQYTYPMYLGEVSEQELWDIININIGATTLMTKMMLPQMTQRKKGAIINVSSSSELQPLPLMTVYAATKVFIKSFSEALRVEYQGEGITVQHLAPFFINTKMNAFSHRLQENSFLVPDAETYAASAINTLGRVNRSTGYWAHGIQYFFTMIPPMWIRTYIGAVMNQIFRKDYLYNIKTQVSFL